MGHSPRVANLLVDRQALLEMLLRLGVPVEPMGCQTHVVQRDSGASKIANFLVSGEAFLEQVLGSPVSPLSMGNQSHVVNRRGYVGLGVKILEYRKTAVQRVRGSTVLVEVILEDSLTQQDSPQRSIVFITRLVRRAPLCNQGVGGRSEGRFSLAKPSASLVEVEQPFLEMPNLLDVAVGHGPAPGRSNVFYLT